MIRRTPFNCPGPSGPLFFFINVHHTIVIDIIVWCTLLFCVANIATLTDCLKKFGGLGDGEVIHLIRMAQDAGILPVGKRGGWRSLPEVTAEQIVGTLFVVAGTRLPGMRNKDDSKAMNIRLGGLVTIEPPPCLTGMILRNNLETIIKAGGVFDGYTFPRVLIFPNENSPEAEIWVTPSDGGSMVYHYCEPKKDMTADNSGAAFVIGSRLILELSFLLKEQDVENTAE